MPARAYGTSKPARITLDHSSKPALKEAFAPDDQSWRRDALGRGAKVIEQGLGLAFTE